MPTDRNLNSFTTLTPPGTKPVVNSIMRDFSAEALAELRLWLEQNPPAIGISNILGFSQFTAQAATPLIGTEESTTSTSYTDLATTGPTLTNLPDGKYVIFISCSSKTSAAGTEAAKMSVSVNGVTAVDTDGTHCGTGQHAGSVSIITATLAAGGNNTITAKYRSTNGTATATFFLRRLVALRYANK